MKLRIHEEKLDVKGGLACEYKINISCKKS